MQLVVAEFEILGGQRLVGARLRALHVVHDEVIRRERAIERLRQVGAGDPELQPAARRVQDDRRDQQRRRGGERPGPPAAWIPPAPEGGDGDRHGGPDPDQVDQPEHRQRRGWAQRLVVDRPREVAAERIVSEHRRIAVQAKQRPEQRGDRERKRNQAAAPRQRQRGQHAGGRGVQHGGDGQQDEEPEAHREAAVPDAQRIGQRQTKRDHQKRRRHAAGEPAPAQQRGGVGGPAAHLDQAAPDVDGGQGRRQTEREAEVVAEDVEERNEAEDGGQDGQEGRPDQRPQAETGTGFVDGSARGT